MRTLSILLTVILLSGCVPYADTPLTDSGVQPIDAEVLGTWYWNDKGDSGFLHIGLDEAAKSLKLILVEWGKNNELVTSEFSGHTSNLKGMRYINLKPIRPEGEATGFLLIRYVIKKNALGISLMNTQAVTKDIESGTLKGEVIRENLTSAVHITASQEMLRRYILEHDSSLYTDTKFLSRLSLPSS